MPSFIKLSGLHLGKLTNIIPHPGVVINMSSDSFEAHFQNVVVTYLSGKDEGAQLASQSDGVILIPANRLVRLSAGVISTGKFPVWINANPKLSLTGVVSGTGLIQTNQKDVDCGITLLTVKQTEIHSSQDVFFLCGMD